MSLFSVFRKKELPRGPELFADLDSIIEKDVWFKLHGKARKIKPLTAEEFMIFANALSGFYALKDVKNLEPSVLVESCYQLASTIVDPISKDDISEMSQAQWSALFTMIMDKISGKLYTEEKKSVNLTAITLPE